MQGAAPLASPGLNPRGTGSPCRCGKLNGGLPRRCPRGGRQRYPAGGVPALSPVNPAFNLLPCPLPRRGRIDPRPPSRRERGDYRLFFARGFAPCIPGAEPARHWNRGRTTHPAGVCLRNCQLAAKPIEQPFYWQCRQPRRGGTGGEELRRLRWSSPPGQGEPVPQRGKPPCPPPGTGTPPQPRPARGKAPLPPPGTTAAGIASAARVQSRGMQGAKPRSPQRHCRKHPRFSTPCGKDCGLFPAFFTACGKLC